MTSPGLNNPIPAQTSQVISREDYAVLGAKLHEAGLDAQQIRQFLAMVQTEAYNAAMVAGQRVALAIADSFLNTIKNTHDQTADRIYQRLLTRIGGGRGISGALHRDCINVVLAERYSSGQIPVINLPVEQQ